MSRIITRQKEKVNYFSNALRKVIKDKTIKNTPNAFFNNAEGNAVAKNAPDAENKRAGRILQPIPLVSKSPLFACVFKALTLIGRKEKRLALWAIFCSTPPTRASRGMVTVPPPMPMPAGIPPKKPNNK